MSSPKELFVEQIVMTSLTASYRRFSRLLTLTEKYCGQGDILGAAGLAQVAARYAFPSNVGLFSSPQLERVLNDIGKKIRVGGVGGPVRAGKARHVLHVLSYAKPIGGDSRFAWRWIQMDPDSRHSVAITSQMEVAHLYDIPEQMTSGVTASGGVIHVLGKPGSSPIEVAQELRRLCKQADVVALHLYPYDTIPSLALAAECECVKTLFVNHSDHTFWVGGNTAHLIVNLRSQPRDFQRARRGLDPDRSCILPIPIAGPATTLSKSEAKRALGYDSNAVVLLTIASPFKYSSPSDVCFLDLVRPIIARHPQTILIAVGPESQGIWWAARTQTNGRIVALGRQWDNDILYAAADIYLDSVPFSSITSLLEAGSRGIALLGLDRTDSELQLLGAGAPGLDKSMLFGHDAKEYCDLLDRLITDPEFREFCGNAVRETVLSLHVGNGWRSALDVTYRSLDNIRDRGCFLTSDDEFDESDLNRALINLFKQVQGAMRTRQLIGEHIGALSYWSRLSKTLRLRAIGFDLCYLNLLPLSMARLIRTLGREAKQLWARRKKARISYLMARVRELKCGRRLIARS